MIIIATFVFVGSSCSVISVSLGIADSEDLLRFSTGPLYCFWIFRQVFLRSLWAFDNLLAFIF